MDPLLIIIIVCFILLIPTAYAAKIGAPYVPTFTRALRQTFNYIGLGEEDTLIDLGAGDGKIIIAAARRGARAYGYELSPIMWFIAWLRTLRYPKAHVYLRNFYQQDLKAVCPTPAPRNLGEVGKAERRSIVYAFLMPQNMERVRRYLSKQTIPNGKYFLSYTFPLKNETPLKIIRATKCAPLYIYDLQKLTQSPNNQAT